MCFPTASYQKLAEPHLPESNNINYDSESKNP